MKVKSHWAIFVILLTSAVICKQRFFMETRFCCHISKTENATTLSRPSTSFMERNFKRTIQFSKFVTSFNFYPALNVYLLSHIAQRSEITYFRKYA